MIIPLVLRWWRARWPNMSPYSPSICVSLTTTIVAVKWKIKPRIHFHCSMNLPVYFVITFFFLFRLLFTFCAIFRNICVDSGIEMDRHDTTKKSRIIELLALSLLLLLLLNDFNAVLYYVENDGAGNCVSVLNIIITIVHLVIGRLAAHCCLFAFMYIFASPLFKEKIQINEFMHRKNQGINTRACSSVGMLTTQTAP